MNFDQASVNAPTWAAKFQAHHAIPESMLDEFPWLRDLAAEGFDINNFEHNGIYLATTLADAEASGRALHDGSHKQVYMNYVRTILLSIERDVGLTFNRVNPGDSGYAEYRQKLQAALPKVQQLSAHMKGGLIYQRVDIDAPIPDGQSFDPKAAMKLQVTLQRPDSANVHYPAPFNEADVLEIKFNYNVSVEERRALFETEYDKNKMALQGIYNNFATNSRVVTDSEYYDTLKRPFEKWLPLRVGL